MPEPDRTPNHDLDLYKQGTPDWTHRDDMERLEIAVEVRDVDAALNDYEPHNGAKFFATDTGDIYIGDGTDWNYVATVGGGGSGDGAPTDASYVTLSSESALDNETRHVNVPESQTHPPRSHGDGAHSFDALNQGGTLTASLDGNGYKITNAADPSNAQDYTTKSWVENNTGGSTGVENQDILPSSVKQYDTRSPIRGPITEAFESGNLDHYTGETSVYSIETATLEGDWMLRCDFPSVSGSIATYGIQSAAVATQRGFTYSGYVRGSTTEGQNVQPGFLVLANWDSNGNVTDGYQIRLNIINDEVEILKWENGSFVEGYGQSTDPLSLDQWYRLELDAGWEGYGLIGRVYDADDTLLGTVDYRGQESGSPVNGDGFGWRARSDDISTYTDFDLLTRHPMSATPGRISGSGGGGGGNHTSVQGVANTYDHVGPLREGDPTHDTAGSGIAFWAAGGLSIQSAVIDTDLSGVSTTTFPVELTHYESGAANPTVVDTLDVTVSGGPERIDLSSLADIPSDGEYVLARTTSPNGEVIPARRISDTNFGTSGYDTHTYTDIDFLRGTNINESGDFGAEGYYYYYFDLHIGDLETRVTSPWSTDVDEIYMRPRDPAEEFDNISPRAIWFDTS